MKARRTLAGWLVGVFAGLCLGFVPVRGEGAASVLPSPATRAEATDYRETSSHADVLAFVRALQEKSPCLRVETLLVTPEGREVPLVVAADPLPVSAALAHRDGRPVVYLQANIHAGEVEGKEALLMFLRDLVAGKRREWLRSAVFLVVPIFNADGNDRMSPDNRSYMPNPEKGVGVRQNTQNLDLNRDYVKTETREVRAVLEKVLLTWDPLVYVDLHTTDGSYHRETVTWTSPQGPNVDPAVSGFVWDRLFPSLDGTLRAQGIHPLPYGDFVDDTQPEKGWATFPAYPRIGVDYVGMRNRFSILLEMYAYAPFPVRVAHNLAFLDALADYVRKHAGEMAELARAADRRAAAMAALPPAERPSVALDYERSPEPAPTVTIETFEVEKVADPVVYPRFRPRLDRPKTVTVPNYRKYQAKVSRRLPAAYLIAPGCEAAVAQLLRHGLRVDRLTGPAALEAEIFVPAALEAETRPSEGHQRIRLQGEWKKQPVSAGAGWYVIPMTQPMAFLVAVMLEPEHPDSLVSWNFFDSFLTQQWSGKLLSPPVYRLEECPPLATRSLLPVEAARLTVF